MALVVGKQQLQQKSISYLRSEHQQGKEQILFTHGWSQFPTEYIPLLELLSEEYDVIAPRIYGMSDLKLCTVQENIDITKEFCDTLGMDNYHVIGHSMGAAIGFKLSTTENVRDVIGINPLICIEYTIPSLALRARKITKRRAQHGKTVYKNWSKRIWNVCKHPHNTIKLLHDMQAFCLGEEEVTVPTLLLYAQHDEMFGYSDKIKQHIESSFTNVTLEELVGEEDTHAYPQIFPKRAYERIVQFYTKPPAYELQPEPEVEQVL